MSEKQQTRLHLKERSIVVPFALHSVKTYWGQALERGEDFINFSHIWVRTADLWAVEAVHDA